MAAISNKLADFESTLCAEVGQAVTTILQAIENRRLTTYHCAQLEAGLKEAYPEQFGGRVVGAPGAPAEDPNYGADFSLVGEVNEQIKVVRALRNKIMDEDGGAIREDVSARETKELISSGHTMLQSLLKYHGTIINQDRMRALEAAAIAAVKTLPEAEQTAFFDTLEAALDQIG